MAHRKDGPANIDYQGDGLKIWYKKGKFHRADGPTGINKSGYDWYLDGQYYTFNEWIKENKYITDEQKALLIL